MQQSALDDRKKVGKVKYSSVLCSTRLTPIRTSTALRDGEYIRSDHRIRILASLGMFFPMHLAMG